MVFLALYKYSISVGSENWPPGSHPPYQSSPFNKQPTSKRMIMARNLTLLSCPVLLGNLLGFVFLMHLPLESRLGASTIFISRMNNLPVVHELTPADFSGSLQQCMYEILRSMPLCLMPSSGSVYGFMSVSYQLVFVFGTARSSEARSRGHQMGHPRAVSVNPSTTGHFAQDYGDSPLERARSGKNYTIMYQQTATVHDQSFGCLATVTDTIGSLWTRHFVSHRDLSERLVSQNQHGS
ncbi:hypothetical protein MUK42_16990 [Musa troglodytarum]|uniref:Uncharacterized protein n=1 Tax=Musa troglodytarum TaxID=320322 RepID=A0A9E7H385_9LILI|nr:hypothetical protein MUK42_16990 [Musa troglodytarum]